MDEQVQVREKSHWMQKYYSNPEYKRRHNKYMCEYIRCECNTPVMRCNMTKHKKGKKHKLIMKLYKTCTPAEIQKYLALQNEE
jgi:hypothetical protein